LRGACIALQPLFPSVQEGRGAALRTEFVSRDKLVSEVQLAETPSPRYLSLALGNLLA